MVGECTPQFVCLFLHFGYDKFCVVFAVLISVEYFVGSCYFWILFVLVPRLLVFFSEASGGEYSLQMWYLKPVICVPRGGLRGS